MNINQECSHNKRGAGPIHLIECKAKPISFNSFYTSRVNVFKIDKANLEGHVLSKIKTNLCYALVCFLFDKTFLLVLYPLLHPFITTELQRYTYWAIINQRDPSLSLFGLCFILYLGEGGGLSLNTGNLIDSDG